MTNDQELLQRSFDNDLNDEEMKHLFTALAGSRQLREEFGSLQQLKNELRSVRDPSVPPSLDRKIESLPARPQTNWHAARLPIRRLFLKRIRVPALAVFLAGTVLLIGSMIAVKQLTSQRPETQYVYVYELQPVVVQSHFIQ